MHRRDFIGLTGAAAFSTMLPRAIAAETRPDFVLRPAEGTASLMGADKPATPVWAYDGLCPGPILRIPRNKPVHVRLENALVEPTSVHWHGIRLDNAMDGVTGLTQAPVAPGQSFDYRFTSPDAGTYWYHSHHRSWEQIGRGLYGALIVEEDTPVAVDHDLVFLADDWRLDDKGVLENTFGSLHDAAHGGRMGNWLTVNGDTRPTLKVRPGARVRLRCISAANARIMAFSFPGLSPMVAAIDGQPLATPLPLNEPMELAPAQRADLIIDIPPTPGTQFDIQEVSTGEPIRAALVAVDGTPIREKVLGETLILPANPLSGVKLDLKTARNMELLMEGGAMGAMKGATHQGKMFDMRSLVTETGKVWAFNGIAGMGNEPFVEITRGQTLSINIINDTRWPHAMHMHGHHFKVVERNGQAVSDAPWRDTDLVEVNEKVRIAFVADNPGKWLLHCHMLEHHMAGMGTWLSVV